jgi:coenzyme F420 hydrogenase subunit delta
MGYMDDILPDWATKPILVLGCGNILLGDDGFGPAVVEYIKKNYQIPSNVCILNAGTSVRKILFPILISEIKPKRIIIVDAVDVGRTPGEVFEINIDDIPANKIDDFSMHQLPTSNLLKELKDVCNIDVIVIAVQVENIPDDVTIGLSRKIIDSVPKASDMVFEKIIEINQV